MGAKLKRSSRWIGSTLRSIDIGINPDFKKDKSLSIAFMLLADLRRK